MRIHTFVIVPPVLRCHDSVSDKNHIRLVDLDFRFEARRGRDEIIGIFKINRFIVDGERHSRLTLNPGQRHFLRVCAVWISRLQPDLLKLIADVFDRKFFAFRSWCASFKFIRRKNLDVRQQSVRRDCFQCRL